MASVWRQYSKSVPNLRANDHIGNTMYEIELFKKIAAIHGNFTFNLLRGVRWKQIDQHLIDLIAPVSPRLALIGHPVFIRAMDTVKDVAHSSRRVLDIMNESCAKEDSFRRLL